MTKPKRPPQRDAAVGPRAAKSASEAGTEPVARAAATPAKTSAMIGDRIAKALARAGVCSRRDAEHLIITGRVAVNGKLLTTPAFTVTATDIITVDGALVASAERPRLWRYHKPSGLVTTHRDPVGRPTVFEHLPEDLPRVISIGRLDLTSEGLLLLTNDGAIARALELPSTAWVRRYRVRAFGTPYQADLDALAEGIVVDGVQYGSIDVKLDRVQGSNVWLSISLTEGKNREIRKVLEAIGLTVNRLIRVSYGPFQLLDLPPNEVEEVRPSVLRDQIGGIVPHVMDVVKQMRAEEREAAAEPKPGPPPKAKSGPPRSAARRRPDGVPPKAKRPR